MNERWTQEDVDRINAQRGAKLPAHIPPQTLEARPVGKTGIEIGLAKTHKYRAEPCIVTADLTLFRIIPVRFVIKLRAPASSEIGLAARKKQNAGSH